MRKCLWKPTETDIYHSRMWDFLQYAATKNEQIWTNYSQLYDWSVENPVQFWEMIWDYFGIIGDKDEEGLKRSKLQFRHMEWFPGSKLNYCENMLRFLDGEDVAISFYGEDKVHFSLNRNEVKQQVLGMARALQAEGIGPGDVVAGYMPNLPQTIIAMLGTAAVGAIWCSCATDIGTGAVIDRIGQTSPKVLITTDGYYYKGKKFSLYENILGIQKGIASLKKTVVAPYVGIQENISELENTIIWNDFLIDSEDSFIFTRYEYSHPLVVMFSSGTTGKPKCMVQSAMGLLLNQLKELALHSDLGKADKLLYITTCSWMMWNWQAAALGTGASVVLYDGNPSYPDTDQIWHIIEMEKVTVFGLSASYIHALLQQGFSPKSKVDLSSLREISQTGSALSDDGFDYIYREVKEKLFFNSIAGGTDINGCFAIANPTQPIYSGELQGKGLGMKICCYNEEGKPVLDEQGELVCEVPVPSMPLYFWNDPNGKRYQDAYFNVYDGVWRHGDYVIFHKDTGGITFCGRSDSVLKPSGVRIGTAEIYNLVEKIEEVQESLAIGQTYHADQRIILFVKLIDGIQLDDLLRKKIKKILREKASPRHVPAEIIQVSDIPHTLNGKKVESAITNIANGRSVTNRDALSNPESLDEYEKIFSKLK